LERETLGFIGFSWRLQNIYIFFPFFRSQCGKIVVARRMNPSEPNKPGGNTDELPADTGGQAPDKGAYFPEFAKLEDEFDTADYRHCSSDKWLDLETTYVHKSIWGEKSLYLTHWRQLSDLEALTLAQFNGDLTIDLDDEMEPELQMHLGRVLAEHRGLLFLYGSINLTPEAATALVQHPGPVIIDLANLDFTAVSILKTRPTIEIFSDFWSS
jgi:hypothetical protein